MTLLVLTVVTNKSWSSSLSTSANEAAFFSWLRLRVTYGFPSPKPKDSGISSSGRVSLLPKLGELLLCPCSDKLRAQFDRPLESNLSLERLAIIQIGNTQSKEY